MEWRADATWLSGRTFFTIRVNRVGSRSGEQEVEVARGRDVA
jgi:hypothetical protein